MSSFISTTLSQTLNCETKTSLLTVLEWEFRIFVRMFAKFWASLMTQTIKNLPAMKETKVLPLGGEDPLEKGMATHSSILAWRIPWTEERGGHSPWGHRGLDTTEWLTLSHSAKFCWLLSASPSLPYKHEMLRREEREKLLPSNLQDFWMKA